MNDLERAAKALMDSVNFDMIGIDGRGGNGGLISLKTMRCSDELRQVLLHMEAERERKKSEELLVPVRTTGGHKILE